MHKKLQGLIAAPFTPMNRDGSINLDVVEDYAELLVGNGVSGVFVCGTTGESMSLTVQERRAMAERWVEVAPDELTVIVHVGHTCVPDAVEMAEHAQALGAWGVGAMPPFFFKPQTIDDLVTVTGQIASAAPELPFHYYHIPEMTGVTLPMPDYLQAAARSIPTFSGLKFTHEDLDEFERCLGVGRGELDVLFGRDEILIEALQRGAPGAVGSTYNFAAPLFLDLMDALQEGDLDGAEMLQRTARELIDLCKSFDASFHAVAKHIMAILGVDCGPVRLPLRELTEEQKGELWTALAEKGFFEYACEK